MAEETIRVQSIWSPPGKEFPKVINTPEQRKYHLYQDQKELVSHIQVGDEVVIEVLETTNQQGKPISRIQNVILDGEPVIGRQVKETQPKSQEPVHVELPYARHPLTLAADWGIAKIQAGQEVHIFTVLQVADIFELFLSGNKEEALAKAKEAMPKTQKAP